jgi:hypothetical protein
MRVGFLASVVVCFLLSGCDEAAMMKKFTSPADEAIAREYAESLQQRKFDRIEHDLDPSLKSASATEAFSKMAALFPADAPESVKVVGAHTSHSAELSTSDMTLEYQFPNKWLLVNVVTQKEGRCFHSYRNSCNANFGFVGESESIHIAREECSSILHADLRFGIAVVYVLHPRRVYSDEGYEKEMVVVHWGARWGRISWSQLEHRAMDTPDFCVSDSVLLDEACFVWPMDRGCLFPAGSGCILAPPMDDEDFGGVNPRRAERDEARLVLVSGVPMRSKISGSGSSPAAPLHFFAFTA